MNQQIPFMDRPTGNSPPEHGAWKTIVHPFQQPSARRSAWQLANSVGGYLLLWGMMYQTSAVSYWLTVPLAILAGGLLVRIFIIFHDCTHNSFFRSRKANEVWGFITGVLCFTPYHHWKREHTSTMPMRATSTVEVWVMSGRLPWTNISEPLVLPSFAIGIIVTP